MAVPVNTVAAGGVAVVDVSLIPALTKMGLPVSEALPGKGIAVTKVTNLGVPVVFVADAGGTASFAAFDGATASNVTLSNGNLTATHANSTVNSGVRVSPVKSSGKYYFEITPNVSSAADVMGIITQAGTYQEALVSFLNATCAYRNTGNIVSNDTSSGKNIGGISAGQIVGVAVDLTARKAWLRKAAGNWNGEVIGISDPAGGLGGVIIEATTSLSPFVAFGSASVAGDAYTINLGATAYANAAPAGFGNWPVT